MQWHHARGRLDLSRQAVIMGIVNVTPDSFSDGGKYHVAAAAIDHGLRLLQEGAAILDVGGESTKPGASEVDPKVEIRRVLPVIDGLLDQAPHSLLSIDTSKAVVAEAALAHGVAIVNDVTAMRGDPAMLGLLAKTQAGVCLMHMQGTPRTMQMRPVYTDVITEISGFFAERCVQAEASGIQAERMVFDPGIGFGKTVGHNLTLLAHADRLATANRPLMYGTSRKSFLAQASGVHTVAERVWPTVATTALLRRQGVRIFRVHDVKENLAALKATEAVMASL